MWLLDKDFKLVEFQGDDVPPYAILSHRWGEEEVYFRDMRKDLSGAMKKAGWDKVLRCCGQAFEDGLQYVWIDTCCIDKRSSAELTEAINSMYRYYKSARRCYVYLADVHPSTTVDQLNEALLSSQWFTRGWTLQELIAPPTCCFFASDWSLLGHKDRSAESLPFVRKLSTASGVPDDVLRDAYRLRFYCVAQKMSWASKRKTKRPEDRAYSLMGIFDINMPILYGEGQEKAFGRLQLEIMNRSTDQTVLAWEANKFGYSGLLAGSPDYFVSSGNVDRDDSTIKWLPRPYHMTNVGLSIDMVLYDENHCSKTCQGWAHHRGRQSKVVYAPLDCYRDSKRVWIGLYLLSDQEQRDHSEPLLFQRYKTHTLFSFPEEAVSEEAAWRNSHRQHIYIVDNSGNIFL